MKKIKLTLLIIVVAIGAIWFGNFVTTFVTTLADKTPMEGVVDRIVGAGNNPDRCVEFTQIASRSVKDRVKIYPGKVYQFSVTSSHSEVAYFQIYDQVNLPINGLGYATPSFSIPIPAMTTALSPALIDYTFPNPLDITASGIMFALSEEMAYYSSGSDIKWEDFVVNICHY